MITVVEAPGCHLCTDAHDALAALADQGHQIHVSSLQARSPKGLALMRRHRAGLSPLVLVDGAFFSQGRLPRRKLARLLAQRSSTTPGPAERAERG
jgi:hypothetical protein